MDTEMLVNSLRQHAYESGYYAGKMEMMGFANPDYWEYGRLRDEAIANRHTTQEQLRAEIARLREANRWIPCSERMPEDYELALVTALRFPTIWNTREERYASVAVYESAGCNGCAFWRSVDGNAIAVTHWRPLPEPPEVAK